MIVRLKLRSIKIVSFVHCGYNFFLQMLPPYILYKKHYSYVHVCAYIIIQYMRMINAKKWVRLCPPVTLWLQLRALHNTILKWLPHICQKVSTIVPTSQVFSTCSSTWLYLHACVCLHNTTTMTNIKMRMITTHNAKSEYPTFTAVLRDLRELVSMSVTPLPVPPVLPHPSGPWPPPWVHVMLFCVQFCTTKPSGESSKQKNNVLNTY